MSAFNDLMSVCFVCLSWTPPEQTHYTNPACSWPKSFCCVFVFFHVCVFAVPPRREQTRDSWVQGECIILVCRQICCGQVFIALSWLHGHCERACQWWDDCMCYQSCEQAWSNPLSGRDPVWLIIMGESLRQEWTIWKPLLSNSMRRCVWKQWPVLDRIYFDKNGSNDGNVKGGFIWCLHIE